MGEEEEDDEEEEENPAALPATAFAFAATVAAGNSLKLVSSCIMSTIQFKSSCASCCLEPLNRESKSETTFLNDHISKAEDLDVWDHMADIKCLYAWINRPWAPFGLQLLISDSVMCRMRVVMSFVFDKHCRIEFM